MTNLNYGNLAPHYFEVQICFAGMSLANYFEDPISLRGFFKAEEKLLEMLNLI